MKIRISATTRFIVTSPMCMYGNFKNAVQLQGIEIMIPKWNIANKIS